MPNLPYPFSTVRDLLRYATSRFNRAGIAFGHGTTNAYDEAAYLILHTLHLPLDTLEPFLDARLTEDEVAAVMQIIERRATDRIPAAYLTHEAWMHGLRFFVDERVIVPRSLIGDCCRTGSPPGSTTPTKSRRCSNSARARAASRSSRRPRSRMPTSMPSTSRIRHSKSRSAT